MDNFFKSEIVIDELKRIDNLQSELSKNTFNFKYMGKKSKLDHMKKLKELVEKQEIMYTRLSLSEDSSAIIMKENLEKSILSMGFSEGTDIKTVFRYLNASIDNLEKYIY